MKRDSIRLARVKHCAGQLKGDPRSVFYGDASVIINPEDAADAIGHQASPVEVAETAIVSDEPNEYAAAQKVAAYNAMDLQERAERTLLPPLACWNAMVIINPQLGKVLAKSLDYMLTKSLNDYPFEGMAVHAVHQQGTDKAVVTINSAAMGVVDIGGETGAHRYAALPFFRFTIASSTLNAAPGSQVTIDIKGEDAGGAVVDTSQSPKYQYTFQRLSNVEAVVGVYIPTRVVSTRTLPFLPLAGDQGDATSATAKTITITFTGVSETDHITVIVPGYATAELKEIATMYSLPSGMIR